MTAAGPVRDSALDALGFAGRVLIRPTYWWAPTLLWAFAIVPIVLIPFLSIPGYADMAAGRMRIETRAELDAFFASFFGAFVPILIATILLSLVITPIANAMAYRLAAQFSDGEPARPFGPGVLSLAWRFFLQYLALFGLVLVGALLCVVAFAVLQAVVGLGFAILVTLIAGIVATFVLVIRVSIAPALLLSGLGLIESIIRAWQMTRGHGLMVFRWFVVIGVIISIAVSVLGGLANLLFVSLGQPVIGSVLSAVASGPATVMYGIILIRLSRLLSRPIPPPAPPDLPAWMNAPGSTEPPATMPGSE